MARNRYRFEERRSVAFMGGWLLFSVFICALAGVAGLGAIGWFFFMTLWPGMFIGLGKWAWHGDTYRVRPRTLLVSVAFACLVLLFWWRLMSGMFID